MNPVKRKIWRRIGWVPVLLCCAYAAAQASGTPAAGQDADTNETYQATTWFGDPFRGHWTFNGEVKASQEYDDNVFPATTLRLSDNVSDFSLRLSAGIKTKRLTFQAHYLPEYLLHVKYDQSNSMSHQYSQDLAYKWSARTDLGWTASASRIESGASSPFLLVQFAPDNAAPVFFPEALQQNTNILTTSSTFTMTHRFSQRVTMKSAISGTWSRFSSFNSTPLIPNLSTEAFQAGASVGWDYGVAHGKSVGLELKDSYAGFLNPNNHQHYQAALVTYSQMLPGRLFFTAGAGPSYSTVQASTLGVATTSLSYALNVALSRTVKTYDVGISLDRGSQVGTVQGSLINLSTAANVSKTWRRRWNTGASFGYARMQTIGAFTQTESYATSGFGGYRWSSGLQTQLRYSYVNQLSPALIGQSFDRNLYAFSVLYTFGERRER